MSPSRAWLLVPQHGCRTMRGPHHSNHYCHPQQQPSSQYHQYHGGGVRRGRQKYGWRPDAAFAVYASVAAAVTVCYWNGLRGDFVHDDIPAVAMNADVLGTGPLARVATNDFWGTPMSDPNSHKSYRPLTTLTFRCANRFFFTRKNNENPITRFRCDKRNNNLNHNIHRTHVSNNENFGQIVQTDISSTFRARPAKIISKVWKLSSFVITPRTSKDIISRLQNNRDDVVKSNFLRLYVILYIW